MAIPRPTCFFCGSIPDSTNDMGQRTCYRHKNSFDLTGTGSSIDETTGTKRSVWNMSDEEEIDDFAVPHLQGVKKKPKRVTVPQRECMICMGKFRTAGVTCGSGEHHTCKSCTRDYITKTLGSKGTVYFDRVPCVQPSCWSLISAKEAKGALTKKVLADFERKEWDMSYLIGGEVDPSSLSLMNDRTKLCPSCKVPIEKNKGCDHISCRCGHDFWWTCGGIGGTCTNYPFHGEGCSHGYTVAPVMNE